ncbi:MAG: hypothetical protein ACUVUD_04930 [bacterium]
MLFFFLINIALTPPVSYKIDAQFLPDRSLIVGITTITFRNISDTPQHSIYLYLYPNAFSSPNTRLATELKAQGSLNLLRCLERNRGSIAIKSVDSHGAPLKFKVEETTLEIILPRPISPQDSITFKVSFTTRIPALNLNFGKTGSFFILTRWYPQVAAFDRWEWHLGTFHYWGSPLGSFADYDVKLHFPKNYTIAAPGSILAHNDTLITLSTENQTDFSFVAGKNLISFRDTSAAPSIRLFLTRNLLPHRTEILHKSRLTTTIYSHLFGPYPFEQLTIVAAPGITPTAIFAPGIIIIGTKPLPFTRLWERTLAQEIARQFLSFNPAPDELSNPLLFHGLPAYAATRYLETVYGEDNIVDLPFTLPFFRGLSDLYLHQVYFYLAATNNLTNTLTEPTPPSLPFVELWAAQAVLLLKSVEKKLGFFTLDSAIRRYRELNLNRHPTTAAFIAALTHLAGPEKQLTINWLLSQDGKKDISISGIRRYDNRFNVFTSIPRTLLLPVELKTVFTDRTFRIDTVTYRDSIVSLPAGKKPSSIVIDPDEKILDANRWNNHYPHKVEVKPIFALPSFDAYQIFYGPWFWYDNYRGFQPGIWLAGRKFIDAGPLKGEHNWTFIQNYASHKSDWHTGASYQTPLIFYPFRSRLYFSGDNSFRDRGFRIYLLNDFGHPFSLPKTEFDFGYRFYELLDPSGRDPRAWEPARTAELQLRLTHNHRSKTVNLNQELLLKEGTKPLHSKFQYTKLGLTENLTVFLPDLLPISLRIFAGAILGTTPPQDEFYLSGGLSYTPAEPISWAYEGWSSGQEHWHYDGDVNCRGYYGLYRRGRFAYGLNLNLVFPSSTFPLPLSLLQPFFDIGNVGDALNRGLFPPCLDAGVRLKLGPLYADFPFWKSKPEPKESHFAFRWSLGLKISDLTSGF